VVVGQDVAEETVVEPCAQGVALLLQVPVLKLLGHQLNVFVRNLMLLEAHELFLQGGMAELQVE